MQTRDMELLAARVLLYASVIVVLALIFKYGG